VALVEQRYDDALQALASVFKKSPADFEGLMLRGRVRLARGEAVEATQDFQVVLKTEPAFAPARYYLALAYIAADNVQQARADLHLRSNAPDLAIEILRPLISKHPGFQAHLLLGAAYLRKQDAGNAAVAFETIVRQAPKDARGPYLVGLALLSQGKRADAKRR